METYKERFIKEFKELNERTEKLGSILIKYDIGTLEFTPTCSINILRTQYFAMCAYRNILIERANIENINLN